MKKLRALLFVPILALAVKVHATVYPQYQAVQITTATATTPPLQTGSINIASGTVANLNASTAAVTGLVTASSMTATNRITAGSFSGSGILITNIGPGSTNYLQNTSVQESKTLNVSSGTIAAFTSAASTITALNVTTINGAAPASTGRWVQIVSSSTALQTTTTSGTYGSTTIGLNITPSSASNKIIIYVQGTVGISETVAADNTVYATIFRGAGDLSGGSGFCLADVNTAATDSYNNLPCTMVYIDSPATTSQTTYTVKIKVAGGTGRWNNGGMTALMYAVELSQ